MKHVNGELLVVQVYVDDIIFGSTNKTLCEEFEALMKKKFQMSAMGELTFFLGLQVKQMPDGIFISQTKYVKDILKKFDLTDSKPASTPADPRDKLHPNPTGKPVNQTHYRSMIGSLMYLTASRPDIMFSVCLCARYQADPKESHEIAVKRIFRYLKGNPDLGLMYPKDEDFYLTTYTDSDFGGDNWDRKSTSGGCQYLGNKLVSCQCKKQTNVSISTAEAEYIAASQCCSQVLWIQNQMLDFGFNFLKTPLKIDNKAAIFVTKNPVNTQKQST